MSHWRGPTGAVRLIGLLVALSLALGAMASSATPVVRASGVGPCSPLTARDLAQPQVTRKGAASARLSRTQGTNGTQFTLTGSGWPAGATIGLAIVTDHSGQFLGGPLVAPSVTASTSGALPSLTFRLPSGESALCQNGMSLNGARLSHVTILFLAYTLDSDLQHTRERVPLIFTLFAGPTLTSPSADNVVIANAQAGASMPLVGAGWEPGEPVTITSRVTPWQGNAPESPTATPTATPVGAVTVTANQQGGFTLPYRLPAVAPLSTVTLLVHSHDARYGDVTFTAQPTYFIVPPVFPSIDLNQRTILAGDAVIVTGDHWQPGQQGIIEYCRGLTLDATNSLYCDKYSAQSLGSFQADSAGHFAVRVRLPANAQRGDITVQARIANEELWRPSDTRPFAAAQPLTIVASTPTITFTQTPLPQAQLLAAAQYFGGWLLLLAAIVGLYFTIRRRDRTPPTP